MSEQDATLDEFTDREEPESGNQENKTHPRFGCLPPEWEIEEIADVAEVVGGSTPTTDNEDYWDGKIKWATPTDITGLSGNTINETEDTLTEEGLESASTHLLPPYSVLMTSRATIGECAVNTVEIATNQGFKNLVPSQGVNPWYLHYRMLATAAYLDSLGSGSTFDEVSKSVVQTVEIPIPPLEEQRQIASMLYNVDQAIQKTEEIIIQINRVKKGLLQELFTTGYYDHTNLKETRAGKIPEPWEVKKIKSHVDLISGAHVKSDLVSDDSSLTPYLTGPEDFDEFGFTVTKYTNEPTKFCEPQDTLVTVKGSGCGKSTYANQRACISRQLKALRPKDNLQPLYLFYFVKTKQNFLESLAEGSAIPGLSNSHLTTLDIPVPSPEEQSDISNALREVDYTIEQEREYKNQLKRLKQGLMQDLLSGTVRTTDTNISVLNEIAKHG
ncbi:restriction endonuclease subunit S [Halomicrobium katesii]|uniref:restriction endonuclease subunit S n=1 Tax=Halomicrobium katesii TaxID=437163 RepID=UPI0009B5BB47|nr:restriction endonuclease subunit S [Halomicrobium katesii]